MLDKTDLKIVMIAFIEPNLQITPIEIGGSVIPADVKTPDNKFARIIKPGRNMPAVKTPDKKICLVYSF